jgi:hypothetical protein
MIMPNDIAAISSVLDKRKVAVLANTLNNQSRQNHNGYGLDMLLIPPGDPPADSQSEVPRIQPCLLIFVLPPAGSAGNDQDRGHKEPLYPAR